MARLPSRALSRGCLQDSKRSLLLRGNRSLTVEQEVAEETEAREPCSLLLNQLAHLVRARIS
jgi:hypothetical protein